MKKLKEDYKELESRVEKLKEVTKLDVVHVSELKPWIADGNAEIAEDKRKRQRKEELKEKVRQKLDAALVEHAKTAAEVLTLIDAEQTE